MVSGVGLQTFFGERVPYFIVTVLAVDLRRPRNASPLLSSASVDVLFAWLSQLLGQTRYVILPTTGMSPRSRGGCSGLSSPLGLAVLYAPYAGG
jgi:hypothetical protein